MAVFCIPKHLVEKLKESALKKEIDIKKLYGMSSVERRAFFESFTDAELGKFINTEFEKAIISQKKTALTDWAKSVFTPEAKTKPAFKHVLDKIKSLDDLGVLDPKTEKAFLEDLVSDKLGISVSPEEVKAIAKKATKIDEAQVKLGNDLGNPLKTQENIDFFKAKKEMDDYLMSLTPAPKLRVLTGTIGRGMMLASVKSPVLNIGSNIEIGFAEALSRRLTDMSLKGADNKLAISYVKMVNKIYQATGYDVSRMVNLRDTGASGERVLGHTVHAQGAGKIRKVGRVIEDIVFKQLMGAPDVAFSAVHFSDSVNISSLKMSKGDKALAKTFMEDSMRIEPQTPQGEILRAQGILDAQKATWTDTSWASRVSEGIRKILNEVSGDLRAGDYFLPFIKTPSNVIATGMEYAGTGIPKALFETVKAIRTGELGSKEYFQKITRGLVRSGLGITGAIIIAKSLKDDDFVGAYDPARAQIESLRNSNYNAIRIGNKWVNVDWLGPLAIPVTAIMYSRKYGNTVWEKGFQYGKGIVSAVKNIPGISDIYDFARKRAYKSNQSLDEMTSETSDFILSEAFSRLIPSIVSDIAKATDIYDRVTGSKVSSIMSKIPGVRQTLPIKTDIFGEQVKGEPAWSDILFGARVKTNKETDMISEINNISKSVDKTISFTDWSKSSSKTIAQFKEKVGADRFDKAKIEYGKELKNNLEDLFRTSKYKNASNEEKLKMINSQDSVAQSKILKRYNFKYKKEDDLKERAKTAKTEKSIAEIAGLYVEAFGVDPLSALHTLFTKEQLKDVRGDAVIMERMGVSASQAVRKKGGASSTDRLDHTVPLEIGGSNSKSNLKIVTYNEWKSYTPVENFLGNLINKGKIKEKEAQNIIKDFKNGKISKSEIFTKYK